MNKTNEQLMAEALEKKIVVIYDRVGRTYYNPINRETTEDAQRAFQDLVGNKETEISKHPYDYDLFELGTYNPITGRIDAYENPKFIVNGGSFSFPKESEVNDASSETEAITA